MNKHSGLIILDRDGVLNQMCLNPEHGIVDSPLHPSQVEVFDWSAPSIKRLTEAGYALVIATNQPSATKGKTTLENLKMVHAEVLLRCQQLGGVIQESFICYHVSEQECLCRKPKTQMLEQAQVLYPGLDTWMVGDGITDIEAGHALGVKTAFLGPHKTDAMKIFHDKKMNPDYWCSSLLDFTNYLLNEVENA